MNNTYTFRFDDISINTDIEKLRRMCAFLRKKVRDVRIIMAVSPAVYDMSESENKNDRERVFPAMLHTKSDFTVFYKMQKVGIPEIVKEWPDIEYASHGMAHVDHRLLSRGAQELSIVMSSALVRTNTFVPPFHKWNEKTVDICNKHKIRLITMEEADWRHLKYHPFDARQTRYYLHTHDLTYDEFSHKFSSAAN
jgi:hypothetical protein